MFWNIRSASQLLLDNTINLVINSMNQYVYFYSALQNNVSLIAKSAIYRKRGIPRWSRS